MVRVNPRLFKNLGVSRDVTVKVSEKGKTKTVYTSPKQRRVSRPKPKQDVSGVSTGKRTTQMPKSKPIPAGPIVKYRTKTFPSGQKVMEPYWVRTGPGGVKQQKTVRGWEAIKSQQSKPKPRLQSRSQPRHQSRHQSKGKLDLINKLVDKSTLFIRQGKGIGKKSLLDRGIRKIFYPERPKHRYVFEPKTEKDIITHRENVQIKMRWSHRLGKYVEEPSIQPKTRKITDMVM